MQLEKLCADVCGISREAGKLLMTESGKRNEIQVQLKGHNDFVTEVDKKVEQFIVDKLLTLLPDAGFITEENTLNLKDKEFEWIIDPLDGTTNFIHGIPCYSVSIALRIKQRIVLGVIYEVNLDECFFTWKDAPSFLNGDVIRVSPKKLLSQSLIATGFPNRDYSYMKEYMALLNDLMFNCHGIRRLGSAAVDLAWVACGRFEAFYEYYLSPWDVAAGAILVTNAGGLVTDFSRGDNYLFGGEIIASNNLIHNELNNRLRKHFDHD